MAGLLQKVGTPSELKALPRESLPQLAAEIRAEILSAASEHGGHVSSNLGAVELEIALLRAFDPPRDKILFDVSHQCYAWKLLTGRADRFRALRRTGGPSGFLKRSESPMDAFGAGHAGTALSAALGFAAARDLRGGTEAVVAVVGDASIVNGISLEALNCLGDTTKRILVVLNDNDMSIGRPVGAFARAFAQIMDCGGGPAERIGRFFRPPPPNPFDHLGIRYVGPVDGHDAAELEDALRALRDAPGPTVLHVRTQKGRGWTPAAQDPEAWHSAPPFDPATGRRSVCAKGTVAWSDVFGETLCALASENPAVYATTAGMTSGTGLSRFAASFPERFRDVGISEEHQATFAAGLAAAGMRPVVAVYSTFFQRAVDGAIHDIALQNLPVTFALDRAGVVPGDGPTHHGVFDLALLSAVPGVVLAQPRTPADLAAMLRMAVASGCPFAIRYPRGTAPDDRTALASSALGQIRLGKAAVISQTGPAAPQVAIWTLGPQDAWADAVANGLAASRIGSVRVDARFVRPVDTELLRRQAETDGVRLFVSFEDAVVSGGLGSAMRDALDALPHPPRLVRFGWPTSEFPPHASSRADLERMFGIDPDSAVRKILDHLDGTNHS